MLPGFQPFSGDSATGVGAGITADPPVPLRSIRDDVPRELERVVMKALEKDRTRRFSDAAAFAAAIAPLASPPTERGSALSITPAPMSTERDAEPTLESPRGLGVPPRAHAPSHTATSRSLWTLAILAGAVLVSVALFPEPTRSPMTPHPSASERP